MEHNDLFDAAIRLENKCAAVYRALSTMFAEKQNLFTPTIPGGVRNKG